MASRRNRGQRHPSVELNITAFMNLMVVLVPFLLMTAVFTHLAIIELNLPNADSNTSKQDKKQDPFELRLTIRKDAILLSDNKGGLIKKVDVTENGHNYALLKQYLKQIKASLQQADQDTRNITILSEKETPYDTLIQVMDATRSYATTYEGEQVIAELFPNISIGDAPTR